MPNRTVTAILKADISGFTAGMKKAQQDTKDFTKNATESAAKHQESWNKIGTGMMATGAVMAAGVGLAVKSFMDFDASMSQVQAGTGAAGKSLEALRAAAIDAGAKTQYSATEAADAITAMGKAGVSTGDILSGGLTGALSLAAAGQLDVGQAAEIAATAMNQFGLEGKDIPHIADLLAAGAGKAMGSVQDLAGALKYVGPVAKGLGISIEETTGTLAMFAQQGILGEQAGTSLRGVLLTMTSPSGVVAKHMEELGINVYGANGKFIGLKSAAGELQKKLGPLDEATRNQALGQIFGNEQVTAARVLYDGGSAAVDKWTKATNDAGFAAEQAAALTDNLKGDVERLGGSLSSVLIQSGSGANGMLRAMTQELQGVVDLYGSLPVPVQQGATAIAAVGAAALLAGGGLTMLLPKVAAGNAALANMGRTGALASAGISKVGSMLMGPVGIGLAVGTLALGYFAKQAQESKARVDALADSLDSQTGAITDNTLAWVNKRLDDSGQLEQAKKMGIATGDTTLAVLGNTDALNRVKVAAAAYAAQGEVSTAKTARNVLEANNFTRAITGGNTELTKGVAKHKLMADTQKATGDTAAGATAKAQALTQAEQTQTKAAEDNKKAHDDLIASITGYGSAMLAARGDARSYEAAIDAATAALKANGRTLDIGTEKGRANQTALDGIATSATKAAQSYLENAAANGTLGAAQRTVTGNVAAARTQFIAMAVKMGMSETAAAKLATQSGLTAGRVKGITGELIALGKQKPNPTVNANITPAQKKRKAIQDEIDAIRQNKVPGMHVNTAAGKERLADLQAQIKALTGKTVNVDVLFGNRSLSANKSQAAAHNTGSRAVRAAGGPITGPGTGTSDEVPIMGSNGEHMLTASDVSAAGGHDAIFAYRKSLHGFAAGGPITLQMPSKATVNSNANARYDEVLRSLDIMKLLGNVGGGGGGGGGGAARWAPLVLQVLAMLGQSASWLPAVLHRINFESGGNPQAINNTDSNAKAGINSRGLMQTVPGTFAAYAGPFRGRGIYDPFANIYAGLNYAIQQYGSLAVMTRPGGYAAGTGSAAPGWAVVGEDGPEWVKFNGGETVTPSHGLDPAGMRHRIGTSNRTAAGQQATVVDMGGVRADLAEQTGEIRRLVSGFGVELQRQARTMQTMQRSMVVTR